MGGDRYVGPYQDGKKHGPEGTFYFANGDRASALTRMTFGMEKGISTSRTVAFAEVSGRRARTLCGWTRRSLTRPAQQHSDWRRPCRGRLYGRPASCTDRFVCF